MKKFYIDDYNGKFFLRWKEVTTSENYLAVFKIVGSIQGGLNVDVFVEEVFVKEKLLKKQFGIKVKKSLFLKEIYNLPKMLFLICSAIAFIRRGGTLLPIL